MYVCISVPQIEPMSYFPQNFMPVSAAPQTKYMGYYTGGRESLFLTVWKSNLFIFIVVEFQLSTIRLQFDKRFCFSLFSLE